MENVRAGPSSVLENNIKQKIEVKDFSLAVENENRAWPSSAEDGRKGPSTVLAEHLEQTKEHKNMPKLWPVGLKSRPQTASNQLEAVRKFWTMMQQKYLKHLVSKLRSLVE